MNFLLRLVRLLALVVWAGGLVFFAFVEAPSAFHVMGTTRQFALLIDQSITALNQLGEVAGLLFLLATALLWMRYTTRPRRLLVTQIGLVVPMIAATIYVQRGILPAMERDRAAAGGDIATLAANSPTRAHFDRLHSLSENVEGSALFLGLGVVGLMAFEQTLTRAPQ